LGAKTKGCRAAGRAAAAAAGGQSGSRASGQVGGRGILVFGKGPPQLGVVVGRGWTWTCARRAVAANGRPTAEKHQPRLDGTADGDGGLVGGGLAEARRVWAGAKGVDSSWRSWRSRELVHGGQARATRDHGGGGSFARVRGHGMQPPLPAPHCQLPTANYQHGMHMHMRNVTNRARQPSLSSYHAPSALPSRNHALSSQPTRRPPSINSLGWVPPTAHCPLPTRPHAHTPRQRTLANQRVRTYVYPLAQSSPSAAGAAAAALPT
jgi:hypothetical protein